MPQEEVPPPSGPAAAQELPAWRRIGIRTSAVVSRPRQQVWAELADPSHPAWSDGEPDAWALVEGSPAFGPGSRRVTPFAVGPPHGILTTLCQMITEFTEGWRYTTVTFAGSWEHTETLLLSDGSSGDTHVDIYGWFSGVATVAGAELHRRRLTHLARAYLERAQRWQPGDPPRPIVVPRDL